MVGGGGGGGAPKTVFLRLNKKKTMFNFVRDYEVISSFSDNKSEKNVHLIFGYIRVTLPTHSDVI
jgi:hypothetical protein